MAMSARLSVTAITSVDTMLKAATATISSRMRNIMFFSICTARKKLAWLRVQSLTQASASRKRSSSRADLRRGEQVVDLEAHAGDAIVHAVERLRVGHVDQRQAGVEFEHAGLEHADHA
jgi:hypothetical protein